MNIRKILKVYIPFAKSEIQRFYAYRVRVYLWLMSSVLMVFLTYYLWKAIYDSSGATVLSGFTFPEMVSYIVLVFAIGSLVESSVAGAVGMAVNDGSIAMTLIRPINYRMTLLSRQFGGNIIVGMQLLIGALVWLVFFRGFYIDIFILLKLLLSCSLGFMIYCLLDFCFGMVAFYTTYVFGLMIFKFAVINLLSGMLIPITFFPEAVQRVFDFLPFQSIIYIPAMVGMNKISDEAFWQATLVQLIWVVVLYLFGSFCWTRAVKRLTILGG